MIRIPRGLYFTVEDFRKKNGYKTCVPIYRAIRLGLIDGVIKIGNRYLIPSGSVIEKQNIKSGKYVGVSSLIKQNKERLGINWNEFESIWLLYFEVN